LTATASFDVLADIERELNIKEDDGRTFIHILLDDENTQLIIIFGMLSQQYRKKDYTKLYKEHKDTSLVNL
jgi:hypothetical protein